MAGARAFRRHKAQMISCGNLPETPACCSSRHAAQLTFFPVTLDTLASAFYHSVSMPGLYVLMLLFCLFLCPANAQQAPRLSLDRSGVLTWVGEYGVAYHLQATARLENRVWTNVASAIAGQSGRTIAVTNNLSTGSQAFYRVIATNAFACTNTGGTACASPAFLGAFESDISGGFLCPSLSCATRAQRTGCGSAWFSLRLLENSDCVAPLRIQVDLQSPPGVDYDLYLYRRCGDAPVASSRLGAGTLDSVTHNINDSQASNDSTDIWIEVRYSSGSQPGNWALTVRTRNCN